MNKFFSNDVNEALKYLYYSENLHNLNKGYEILKEADKKGDAEASYFLSRLMYVNAEDVNKYEGFLINKNDYEIYKSLAIYT